MPQPCELPPWYCCGKITDSLYKVTNLQLEASQMQAACALMQVVWAAEVFIEIAWQKGDNINTLLLNLGLWLAVASGHSTCALDDYVLVLTVLAS